MNADVLHLPNISRERCKMIPLYSRVYLCQCCNLQYLWISHIPTHSDLVGCLQMVGYMFPPPLHHVWDLNYRLTWSMYYINPCISGNTCTITIVSKILSWSHCQYSFPSSYYVPTVVLSHSQSLASSHTTLIYYTWLEKQRACSLDTHNVLWLFPCDLASLVTVHFGCILGHHECHTGLHTYSYNSCCPIVVTSVVCSIVKHWGELL